MRSNWCLVNAAVRIQFTSQHVRTFVNLMLGKGKREERRKKENAQTITPPPSTSNDSSTHVHTYTRTHARAHTHTRTRTTHRRSTVYTRCAALPRLHPVAHSSTSRQTDCYGSRAWQHDCNLLPRYCRAQAAVQLRLVAREGEREEGEREEGGGAVRLHINLHCTRVTCTFCMRGVQS